MAVVLSGAAARGQVPVCGPAPDIRAAIQSAESTEIADPMAFDRNIAPFVALRRLYPDDLYVHEAYQDAVRRHGIEGHLAALVAEYRDLEARHPGDSLYHYLYLRSLVGRNTRTAIRGLTEMAAQNPRFAPAHETLAEIYGIDAFKDIERFNTERASFRALCPGGALEDLVPPIPDRSRLIEKAGELLHEGGDPDRVIDMTQLGLTEEEWRSQRIRPFDWYSSTFKRAQDSELRAIYWDAWVIQVRCQRKAGRQEKAAEMLALMERRAAALGSESNPLYWTGLGSLARLYLEANQPDLATAKLRQMEQVLAASPEPGRSAELDHLQKLAFTIASGASERK